MHISCVCVYVIMYNLYSSEKCQNWFEFLIIMDLSDNNYKSLNELLS